MTETSDNIRNAMIKNFRESSISDDMLKLIRDYELDYTDQEKQHSYGTLMENIRYRAMAHNYMDYSKYFLDSNTKHLYLRNIQGLITSNVDNEIDIFCNAVYTPDIVSERYIAIFAKMLNIVLLTESYDHACHEIDDYVRSLSPKCYSDRIYTIKYYNSDDTLYRMNRLVRALAIDREVYHKLGMTGKEMKDKIYNLLEQQRMYKPNE